MLHQVRDYSTAVVGQSGRGERKLSTRRRGELRGTRATGVILKTAYTKTEFPIVTFGHICSRA